MNTFKRRLFIASLAAILMGGHVAATNSYAAPLTLEKFDHEMHMQKVFTPQSVACDTCHSFNGDRKTGRVELSESASRSTFRKPMKELCHQCHQGTDSKFVGAPQSCVICHATPSGLKAIRPQNHHNVVWKQSHATEARVGADSCMSCHTTSQCVKCHSERNDIEPKNHSRNFRFTHSIQARLAPQRCDACHTKTYCTNCHLGIK